MNDLLDLVYEHGELVDMDEAQRRLALRSLVADRGNEVDLATAVRSVADAIDGYGPLTDLLVDPTVTDVLVNGPFEVWVDGPNGLNLTAHRFEDEEHLRALIDRLLGTEGARIDVSHPIADARLPDGSRIHAVVPPASGSFPIVSIRRFPQAPFTLADLCSTEFMTPEQMATLSRAVKDKATIAISGGTGCGKTTLLNALLGEVPAHERVVTIEETPELHPMCAHFVSLLAREPNAEGRGEITQAALVRASLRMRPDRIVVGEVRGAETMAALTAMSVGHSGSMVTVHARSARDVEQRLVSLALQAESHPSEESLRLEVRRCFEVFVHLHRLEGARKISEIRERAPASSEGDQL